MGKEKPIWVAYVGDHGTLRHRGILKDKQYLFAQCQPIKVEVPQDIAFYRRKAGTNPNTWVIGKSRKNVLEDMEGVPAPEPAEGDEEPPVEEDQ